MKVLGARPRPRVLIVGNPPEDVVAAVGAAAPTVHCVEPDEVPSLAASEFDVTVWWGTPGGGDRTSLHEGLRPLDELHSDGLVLAFAEPQVGALSADRAMNGFGTPDSYSLRIEVGQRCMEFQQPATGSQKLDDLITHDLVPAVRQRTQAVRLAAVGEEIDATPWCVDQAGQIHAAVYELPVYGYDGDDGATAPRVVLPADVRDPAAWIRPLFEFWRRHNPSRFENAHDGWDSVWQTAEERATTAAIERHDEQQRKLLTELERRRGDLEVAARDAEAAAIIGARRLLTDEGDSLTESVREALEAIGFDVRDVDELRRREGKPDKVHDLEITDPDDTDWVCLCEVKGYTNGAKTNDLMKIAAKYIPRFERDHGRRPSSAWYVVNQFRNQPPSARDRPLRSSPEDVAVFAEELAGAVIDTRSLFALVDSFADAPVDTKRSLRGAMRSQTGAWSYDLSDWPSR